MVIDDEVSSSWLSVTTEGVQIMWLPFPDAVCRASAYSIHPSNSESFIKYPVAQKKMLPPA